ncbi:rhodanese-like domain-containing protein [Pseudobutyrivibrio ruminis]|uniref:Rhodanese-related sulfurtransferase n=1 Tax=Pseudobutyrivibrio ruminis DSM 9787 TaxID=1123011 RepID=A0A285T572_9FIRM|nr:rhodanese-like domain-containing protein [Pseudobutyrivibrio ruminis]SOC16512.1 Rhodanese-related sulfurtransferase [Pseudobutyrivibrio ruminis DSM 9787]
MGLFNLFKHVDINAEVEAMKSIENAVLLDVRTEEEYLGGHIPGSKNVPVERIEKVVDVITDKNIPVYVYCLRGSRSASAVSAMEKMGYTNAKSIGGIASYKGNTVIGSN